MPTFDLPPPTNPTPVDVDSLAARQARNNEQTQAGAIAFLTAMRAELGARYSHTWGKPLKQKGADGKMADNPAERRNENNLSPAEVLAGYGTKAAGYFGDFAALVPVAIRFGVLAPDGTHPVTGENMTRPPVGWTVTFAEDGGGTAAYTAPAL